MPSIKIKARKNDIEKAEEILSVTQRFSAWALARRKIIIGVFAGLVAGSFVAWGVQSWSQSQERTATEEYAKVMAKWPTLDPKEAATWERIASDLKGFSDSHKGTSAALSARLAMSQSLFMTGKYAESLDMARSLLSDIGKGSDLEPLVRYQVAMAASAAGKPEEAVAAWEALSPYEGFQRERAWQLARLAAKKGDAAKASELFEAALKAQGQYPAEELIREDLARVKGPAKAAS